MGLEKQIDNTIGFGGTGPVAESLAPQRRTQCRQAALSPSLAFSSSTSSTSLCAERTPHRPQHTLDNTHSTRRPQHTLDKHSLLSPARKTLTHLVDCAVERVSTRRRALAVGYHQPARVCYPGQPAILRLQISQLFLNLHRHIARHCYVARQALQNSRMAAGTCLGFELPQVSEPLDTPLQTALTSPRRYHHPHRRHHHHRHHQHQHEDRGKIDLMKDCHHH